MTDVLNIDEIKKNILMVGWMIVFGLIMTDQKGK